MWKFTRHFVALRNALKRRLNRDASYTAIETEVWGSRRQASAAAAAVEDVAAAAALCVYVWQQRRKCGRQRCAERSRPDHLQHATTTERAVAKGPKTSAAKQAAAGSGWQQQQLRRTRRSRQQRKKTSHNGDWHELKISARADLLERWGWNRVRAHETFK